MNILEIPGNYDFIYIKDKIENSYKCKINIKCKLCELHLLIGENEVAIFKKSESISYNYKHKDLNKLPSCNEMIIKNLLE